MIPLRPSESFPPCLSQLLTLGHFQLHVYMSLARSNQPLSDHEPIGGDDAAQSVDSHTGLSLPSSLA